MYKSLLLLFYSLSFSACTSTIHQSVNKEKEEAFIKFMKVVNTIQNEYVDEVNTTTLVDKALEGMLSNLDAHSSFMDAQKNKLLLDRTKGEFAGVGMMLSMNENVLTVISTIPSSPAFEGGIKSGDIILKINGKYALSMDIFEAVKNIKGPIGSMVKLDVLRGKKQFPIKIKRKLIKVISVHDRAISKSLHYIKINSFDEHVVENIKKVLIKYNNLKGLVLDLRGNPGGLLNQAVDMVDLFVSKGVIVKQFRASRGDGSQYIAHKSNTYSNLSLVVLVNGSSASASEIVSGALQDHKRAIIVGEKTFGKGSVQVVIPIENKEALKLTVARYYLPSGRSIQATGVSPDIIVHQTNDKTQQYFRETDLKGYLKNSTHLMIKNNNWNKYKHMNIYHKNKLFYKKWIKDDKQLKYGITILKKESN